MAYSELCILYSEYLFALNKKQLDRNFVLSLHEMQ